MRTFLSYPTILGKGLGVFHGYFHRNSQSDLSTVFLTVQCTCFNAQFARFLETSGQSILVIKFVPPDQLRKREYLLGTTSSPRRQGATTTPWPVERRGRKPENKTCTTISGKGCVFPFMWKGTTYNTCTARDASELWCPIKRHLSVRETYQWETCILGRCLFDKDQIKSCATTNHRACVFPFVYNNIKYWSCTLHAALRLSLIHI